MTKKKGDVELLSKIDATRISDGLTCEAYFYLRHLRGFVKNEPQLPLIFGSAIHAALAEHYRGNGFKAVLQAFDDVWLREAQDQSDAKRNPERALAILNGYLQRYKQEYWQVVAVEVPFMIPIEHIKYVGIIDLVVKLGDGDRLAIVDHKTTSSLSGYYWLPYKTDADYQGIGYLTAIQKLVGPAETWIPNVLLVDKAKTAFDRQYFTPNTSQFKRRLLHWHRRMLDNYEQDCWMPNPKHCNRWGACPYAALCEIFPDVSKAELIEGYREEFWDPTAALYK